MSDNYFGVCECNLDTFEPVVEKLITFEEYDDAVSYYEEHFREGDSMLLNRNLYLVYINRESESIVQFERYIKDTRCKMISLKKVKNIINGDKEE